MLSVRFWFGVIIGIGAVLFAGEVMGVDYGPLYAETARQGTRLIRYMRSGSPEETEEPASDEDAEAVSERSPDIRLAPESGVDRTGTGNGFFTQ